MEGALIILLRFLVSVHLCNSAFITPNEISDVEESFIKGETEYIMLNLRVTWNEAEIICQAYKNGSLAIVNTAAIRDFLSEALSETNLEMEDLWIGAKVENRVIGFVWINGGGTYIPDDYFIKRGTELFHVKRDCLAFARQYHDIGHYINLDCNLQRPFICEKPYEKIYNGSITTPDWIRIGKYQYGIFFDQKTWKQSVRECRRKHRAQLASFRESHEVTVVGKYLLVGRPSLENAWIGGHFFNGAWRFISEGSPLPEKIDNKTLFPPWRQDRPLKHSGCLLLDRHLANHPVFLEARCERRRSYICAKKYPYLPDYTVIIINGTGYILYFTKKNWDDAWQQCLDINASLAIVHRHNIHDITYIMGENITGVNHVWIGGKLSDDGANFYWVATKSVIQPNNKDVNHYPPWYDNEYSQDYACLNMDRENHNRPMFYGAACDTPQEFICEQKNLSMLPNDEKGDIKILSKSSPLSPTPILTSLSSSTRPPTQHLNQNN